MESNELKNARAKVIEGFIDIEYIIKMIIAQNYFTIVPPKFYFEVLYDEYFSFALSRRILEKIIEEKELIEKLNRLNNIRNVFSHTSPFFREGEKKYAPDPRDTDKDINYKKLYDEFREKAPLVKERLIELLKEKDNID